MQKVHFHPRHLLNLCECEQEILLGDCLKSIDEKVYDGDAVFDHGRLYGFLISRIEDERLRRSWVLSCCVCLIIRSHESVESFIGGKCDIRPTSE